jgi:hypothetical protein
MWSAACQPSSANSRLMLFPPAVSIACFDEKFLAWFKISAIRRTGFQPVI